MNKNPRQLELDIAPELLSAERDQYNLRGRRRPRHLLMAYALQALLDGSKGRAIDIIASLTDAEAAELGDALDELYPMVAGKRAVPYSEEFRRRAG